jgi:hypothetical protein
MISTNQNSAIISLIISLIVLCLILGISNIIWWMLYENAKARLKYNTPYLIRSNNFQTTPKVPINNKSSIISAMGILARIWILAKSVLMLLIKTFSIIGLTPNVITNEKINLNHFTKKIQAKFKKHKSKQKSITKRG